MSIFTNKLAIFLFDTVAIKKGYRFTKARTVKEYDDAYLLYKEEGFSSSGEEREQASSFKSGAINFVAYFNNVPVGLVSLANPRVLNKLYGGDVAGDHYEVRSLVVKKDFRDGAQFVVLGLFRAMYTYSISHGIASWSSCSARNVYMAMRRFCKSIEVFDIDFDALQHPLTRYLVTKNITETYFTMNVTDFDPWEILKKCGKKMLKKWSISEQIRMAIANRLSLNYLGKQ